MNISLTPVLEEFVRRKVASGLYNNASEVIREALRLLVQREAGAGRAESVPFPGRREVADRLASLERLLRDKGVTGLLLFGSVLHGATRPDSDIDILIEPDPNTAFSLVDLASLGHFLSAELGREVDVATREGLDPAVREQILAEAERIF